MLWRDKNLFEDRPEIWKIQAHDTGITNKTIKFWPFQLLETRNHASHWATDTRFSSETAGWIRIDFPVELRISHIGFLAANTRHEHHPRSVRVYVKSGYEDVDPENLEHVDPKL